MADDANPRAIIGANNPPADPFAALCVHFDDLYLETGNWADGVEIETEAQADALDRLIDDWKDAIVAAKAMQDAEIAPLSAQEQAIRERFYPLIADTTKLKGKAIRAKASLLVLKTAWGNKQRAIQAAAAEAARKVAQEAATKAAEAAKAAAGDLAATEQAEELVRDAQVASRVANVAERQTVKGMRTKWLVEMVNDVEAARWAWKSHPDECKAFFGQLADADVRTRSIRTIPGFTITETKVAV